MAILYSTYYGLVRVSDVGPEAKGWATTDGNFEILAAILKAEELHKHGGATPMQYPGFNFATPATPISPTLTYSTTGGSLAPGQAIGVRLAYTNSLGLETQACPETTIQLPAAPERPDAIVIGTPTATPITSYVPGGTYIYVITKLAGTSETNVSDAATVTLPYDPVNTWSVPLAFDPISIYTDGTTQLNIYRSSGFSQSLQLLTSVSTPTLATYTDTNAFINTQQSPPTSNQMNQFGSLNINWNNIATPVSAYTMRVYVTQEIGMWSDNNLLFEWSMQDPSTPLPSSMNYLGSETLALGWPRDITQMPSNPPPVNLATDAVGAPIYTMNADARGWPTWNFVLPTNASNATPVPGGMYFDPSTNSLRLGVNRGWLSFSGYRVNYVSIPAFGPNGLGPNFQSGGPGGWNKSGTGLFGSAGLSAATPVTGGLHGPLAMQVTATGPSGGHSGTGVWFDWANTAGITASANQTYTFSIDLKGTTSTPISLNIGLEDNNLGNVGGSSSISVTNTWNRYSISWTPSANSPDGTLYIWNPVAQSTPTFLVDGAVVTQGTSTDFFWGYSPGYQWSSTVYNSTSFPSAYVHPTQEVGGHSTDNILYRDQGGQSLTTLLNSFATPTAKTDRWQIGGTEVFKASATPVTTNTTSAAASNMSDMVVTAQPNFAGNWIDIDFNSHFYLDTAGATGTIQLLVNGISQSETVRSWTAGTGNQSNSFGFTFATPISVSNTTLQVQWWTSAGNFQSIGGRRTLVAKALF